MQIISLAKVDNQFFTIPFQNEDYQFRLKDTLTTGVFLDVYRFNVPLIMGILCIDRVHLIRSKYKEFPGDLMFIDDHGFDNPQFTYFGDRFQLAYLTPDELTIGN